MVQGSDVWEKEKDFPLYVKLHNTGMPLADLTVVVQDVYDTPVLIITKDEFTELSPGIWKTTINIPKQTARGTYDLIATIEDEKFGVRHARTYTITIRNKKLITYLYEINDIIMFYARGFVNVVFG